MPQNGDYPESVLVVLVLPGAAARVRVGVLALTVLMRRSFLTGLRVSTARPGGLPGRRAAGGD